MKQGKKLKKRKRKKNEKAEKIENYRKMLDEQIQEKKKLLMEEKGLSEVNNDFTLPD